MFENIMNIDPVLLGIIAYGCIVMPLIYALGGAMRKHQKRDMETGEPLD